MLEEYRVRWVIEVTANSYEEAAKEALEIQRDPDSEAIAFDVRKFTEGGYKAIDLMEI